MMKISGSRLISTPLFLIFTYKENPMTEAENSIVNDSFNKYYYILKSKKVKQLLFDKS